MFGDRTLANIYMYLYGTILSVGIAVLSSLAIAQSVSVECDDLISEARKANFVPQVISDPNWGIVRINAPQKYCREPIEVWSQRSLDWPVEIKPDANAPKFLRNLEQTLSSQQQALGTAPATSKSKTAKPVAETKKSAPKVAEFLPTKPTIIPSEPTFKKLTPIVKPPEAKPLDDLADAQAETAQEPTGEQSIIPPSVEAGEVKSAMPQLSDVVRSRMGLGEEEPEEIVDDEAKSEDKPISFGVWLGAGGGILGLFIVGFLLLYRKFKSGKSEDGEDEDDDEGDDEEY